MFKFILYVAIVSGAFMGSASAAPVCGPHESFVKQLEQKYKENRIGYGLNSNGNMAEFFTSSGNDTWTFMLTHPNGRACIIAGGRWENVSAAETSPKNNDTQDRK